MKGQVGCRTDACSYRRRISPNPSLASCLRRPTAPRQGIAATPQSQRSLPLRHLVPPRQARRRFGAQGGKTSKVASCRSHSSGRTPRRAYQRFLRPLPAVVPISGTSTPIRRSTRTAASFFGRLESGNGRRSARHRPSHSLQLLGSSPSRRRRRTLCGPGSSGTGTTRRTCSSTRRLRKGVPRYNARY